MNTLFLTANMDSLGESEFVLTMFGAMAQEEGANLSKRVKFGKKINAQKGLVPQRIFGYDRIDNFPLVIKYEIEDYLTGKQVHIPEEQHFHHDRPEWATPEVFAKAQSQLDVRRTQYDSGEPFKGANTIAGIYSAP